MFLSATDVIGVEPQSSVTPTVDPDGTQSYDTLHGVWRKNEKEYYLEGELGEVHLTAESLAPSFALHLPFDAALRAKAIWPSARKYIEGHDGTATEFFITELLKRDWVSVLKELRDSFSKLRVSIMESNGLEEPLPLDVATESRLATPSSKDTNHGFLVDWETENDVQVYVWIPNDGPFFELEIVFWNDLSFPLSLDLEERLRKFTRLLEIAETIRSVACGRYVILAAEHKGPTEELLLGGALVL
ncbi:MAG: hypothetical protein AAFU77_09305 [Myxococcota bacterium]